MPAQMQWWEAKPTRGLRELQLGGHKPCGHLLDPS